MSGGQLSLTRPAAAVRAGVASLDFCPQETSTNLPSRACPTFPARGELCCSGGWKEGYARIE